MYTSRLNVEYLGKAAVPPRAKGEGLTYKKP